MATSLPTQSSNNQSLVVTRKQAASLLQVHLRTLDSYLAQGRIPYVKKTRKMLRIRMRDLLAFIGE
jgi:excisionase family DNA binding protein